MHDAPLIKEPSITYYRLMPSLSRYLKLDENEVFAPVERDGVDVDLQEELMRELRRLTNGIADGFERRDSRIHEIAGSGVLSRREIGHATGMAESRVNQIVRERERAIVEAEELSNTHLADDRTERAEEYVKSLRRRMPSSE